MNRLISDVIVIMKPDGGRLVDGGRIISGGCNNSPGIIVGADLAIMV